MIDFRPGDRVYVTEKWVTFPHQRDGVVKRVWESVSGTTWVAVLFDGESNEHTCVATELGRA